MFFDESFDWLSFLLDLIGIILVWGVFLYLARKASEKLNTSQKVLGGLRKLVHFFFGYILIKFIITQFPMPDTWENYGNNVLKILVIIGITNIISNIASDWIDHSVRSFADKVRASSIFKNVIIFTVWAISFTIILNSEGISITPILAALGVGGLAVALAVQPPLANLFAGLQLLMSRQIRPGDFVRLSTGEEGVIQDISWRSTLLLTRGELSVIVPNSTFAASVILNNSWPKQSYYTGILVWVDYQSDLTKVRQIALEIAQEVSLEVSDSPLLAEQASVNFTAFRDLGVELSVSVKAKNYKEITAITNLLVLRIHKRFQEEQILIPVRTIQPQKLAPKD